MDAVKLGLAVLLLVCPSALAQSTPDPSTVGDVVNPVQDQAYPVAENQTGEDLTSEDVDIDILIDIRDARFDIGGVMLGGGTAETTINVETTLSIRAVNASRVEQALDAYYDQRNVSLSDRTGIDTSRSAVMADELRSAGGGVLLEAFQAYQEQAAREYLADTLPQITIISLSFDWQNTQPAQDRNDTDPDPREPPLVLAVEGHMRFLDRYSLVGLIGSTNSSEEPTPEERLRQQLEENQTIPLHQRNAFQTLGVGQLVSLQLPPGWRLNLTVQLPQGYTISQATDALEVTEDRQRATYYIDGTGQETLRTTSGVVKLSDRSLVTTTIAGLALGLGLLLRLPTEFAGLRWVDRD